MLTLFLAGLPGALGLGLVLSALAWPFLSWSLGLLLGGAVALAGCAVWVFWLPRRMEGELWRSSAPVSDPQLSRSWTRAFDGHLGGAPGVKLVLIRSAISQFLVFDFPSRGKTVWVSEGWLVAKGETQLRSFCQLAALRLSDPLLRRETSGALLARWLINRMPRGFAHPWFSVRNEVSAQGGLKPWGLALGLLTLLWLGWLIRLTGPRVEHQPAVSGAGLLGVDWLGRDAPQDAVLDQSLSLERGLSSQRARKSILSWLPAHW